MKDIVEKIDRKLQDFALFTIDVIYDRRKGSGAAVLASVLKAFSYLFSVIVQSRFWLYTQRIFRNQPLGCLVVVVGNLTVGGTGKTPVVEKFARSLRDQGRKVAILSRGYKSKPERIYKKFWRWITNSPPPPPRIVSDGEKVHLNSEIAGDEPYMLARNLPGVVVLTDKNRVKAGHYAIKHFGADTLILDDGFQYLPLRGRLNLLLIDKSNPFGNKYLLPRGILREPVKHLKRASYIFITKSDGVKDQELLDTIEKHKPDAEIIECTHKPQYIQKVGGDEKLELSTLKGKKIGTFSGIAAPESFEKLLRDEGAEIKYNERFLDHHRFTDGELNHYFKRAINSDIDMVVTTEKDAVRITKDFDPGIPFYFLRMEIDILSGVNDFEEAVSRICFPKKKMKATRATRSPFREKADSKKAHK